MKPPMVNYESRISIYEENGYVTIVEDLDERKKPDIVIGWEQVIAAIVIINLILAAGKTLANIFGNKESVSSDNGAVVVEEENSSISTETVIVNNSSSYQESIPSSLDAFIDTGILFPDSSSRFLSSDDFEYLGYKYDDEFLVQYAINEIYARNGYDFQKTKWINYYAEYDWYNNQGLSGSETRSKFNSFERDNVRMLEIIRDKLKK